LGSQLQLNVKSLCIGFFTYNIMDTEKDACPKLANEQLDSDSDNLGKDSTEARRKLDGNLTEARRMLGGSATEA
jgi:hypothetical protein